MNLIEKLHEIYKNVGYIQKGQEGKQYKYVGSSDVLATVRSYMADLGVQLQPRILSASVKDFTTKSGTVQLLTELNMTMTWVNVEDQNDKIELPWYAQGMDLAGEKGVGKALTYGEKYFLLKYFNIATDSDDPDAYQEKVDAKKPKPKVSANKVKTIETLLEKLSKNVDKTYEETKTIMLKTAKLNVKELKELTDEQADVLLVESNKLNDKYSKK